MLLVFVFTKQNMNKWLQNPVIERLTCLLIMFTYFKHNKYIKIQIIFITYFNVLRLIDFQTFAFWVHTNNILEKIYNTEKKNNLTSVLLYVFVRQ